MCSRSIMISSKYAMYNATNPLYYAFRSLSLAIFSSSRTLNCCRNFAAKSVKLVGAMLNRSRWSSHLLALPRMRACAIVFIWALCSALLSNNPAAVKYLFYYFSQDLASFLSPSKALGSSTFNWIFILFWLLWAAVCTFAVWTSVLSGCYCSCSWGLLPHSSWS